MSAPQALKLDKIKFEYKAKEFLKCIQMHRLIVFTICIQRVIGFLDYDEHCMFSDSQICS
jgi:hypothetical protein